MRKIILVSILFGQIALAQTTLIKSFEVSTKCVNGVSNIANLPFIEKASSKYIEILDKRVSPFWSERIKLFEEELQSALNQHPRFSAVLPIAKVSVACDRYANASYSSVRNTFQFSLNFFERETIRHEIGHALAVSYLSTSKVNLLLEDVSRSNSLALTKSPAAELGIFFNELFAELYTFYQKDNSHLPGTQLYTLTYSPKKELEVEIRRTKNKEELAHLIYISKEIGSGGQDSHVASNLTFSLFKEIFKDDPAKYLARFFEVILISIDDPQYYRIQIPHPGFLYSPAELSIDSVFNLFSRDLSDSEAKLLNQLRDKYGFNDKHSDQMLIPKRTYFKVP